MTHRTRDSDPAGTPQGVFVHAGEGTPPDTHRLEAGRRIYQAQCASCHGERGKGAPDWQRPNEQGELPAPPHDARTYLEARGAGKTRGLPHHPYYVSDQKNPLVFESF